jgi:hypothetical protein
VGGTPGTDLVLRFTRWGQAGDRQLRVVYAARFAELAAGESTALDEGYAALTRKQRLLPLPGLHDKDSMHIAQLQVDGALLFERVTNTLKLLGDQYLARVYRLASQRFHLEAWDASILRKLETLESIYDKMSDRTTTRRMEVLEWIIIVLIAVSIVLSFFPMGGH